MVDDRKVQEERVPFEAIDGDDENLIGFEEIGPDSELDDRERRAIAELDAGRFISNAAVMRWLEEIAAGRRPPRPQVGD
jgi:hypothetical protein